MRLSMTLVPNGPLVHRRRLKGARMMQESDSICGPCCAMLHKLQGRLRRPTPMIVQEQVQGG
jgi:hypothetical protein